MINKFKKIKKGLTLLEVIISIAILSITIVPLSTLVLTSIKGSNNSEYKQQATALAQKLLEELKINNTPSGDTIRLLNDTVTLTKINPPHTGYNLEFETPTPAQIEGFSANISFLRKESFRTNVAGADSSFDIIIKMVSSTSFILPARGDDGAPYAERQATLSNSNNRVYIAETSDSTFEIYDYNKMDDKTLLFALSGKPDKPGKVKIIFSEGMGSSDIKISSYNTMDYTNDKILSVYSYKNNGADKTNTITNIGGAVRVYDNVTEVSSSNDSRGVYDAKIELYKEIEGTVKKIYEVKSTINVND